MFARDEGRYIGQSQYWARFAVFMIGVPVLLGFGIYSLVVHDYGLGVLAILAVFPLSIWFRFVMMRRCRDIGWPVFLPWTAQGLQFLMFFVLFSGGGSSGGGLGAVRAVSSGSLLIGFADFVLVIALGCIGSKNADHNYSDIFGGEPLDRSTAAVRRPTGHAVPPGEHPDAARAREDDAIARALDAHRRGSVEPAPSLQTVPMSAAPRVAGFGRKGL